MPKDFLNHPCAPGAKVKTMLPRRTLFQRLLGTAHEIRHVFMDMVRNVGEDHRRRRQHHSPASPAALGRSWRVTQPRRADPRFHIGMYLRVLTPTQFRNATSAAMLDAYESIARDFCGHSGVKAFFCEARQPFDIADLTHHISFGNEHEIEKFTFQDPAAEMVQAGDILSWVPVPLPGSLGRPHEEMVQMVEELVWNYALRPGHFTLGTATELAALALAYQQETGVRVPQKWAATTTRLTNFLWKPRMMKVVFAAHPMNLWARWCSRTSDASRYGPCVAFMVAHIRNR